MESDPLRERVLRVLKRHGWNATSFQVLEPDFQYWLHGDDALVAYVDTGSAWVAAGAPVCAPEQLQSVAERFVADAKANGRRVCFFATEQRFSQATSYPALLVGEQPVWDPRRWAETLKQTRSLREQLRRARAAGVTLREVGAQEASVRSELEALIHRWLGSRDMAPMGFLVQVRPFAFEEERRYFVAEQSGKPVAFLAAVPVYARSGWLFEDLIRDPKAPNGTAELLVDAAMRAVAEKDSSYVTLGLVPLAGPVEGWLRVARRGARPLYDFKGLHRFKAKFRPQSWEPLFLSFPPHGSGTAALYDSLNAFARGGFVRFGLETLSRGPTLAIQLLAVL
ncbi:MAG: bifunctional lysylphosphatidylglycerol flippase/synthetase MprF, partial [Myxococcaceae bacterium]